MRTPFQWGSEWLVALHLAPPPQPTHHFVAFQRLKTPEIWSVGLDVPKHFHRRVCVHSPGAVMLTPPRYFHRSRLSLSFPLSHLFSNPASTLSWYPGLLVLVEDCLTMCTSLHLSSSAWEKDRPTDTMLPLDGKCLFQCFCCKVGDYLELYPIKYLRIMRREDFLKKCSHPPRNEKWLKS